MNQKEYTLNELIQMDESELPDNIIVGNFYTKKWKHGKIYFSPSKIKHFIDNFSFYFASYLRNLKRQEQTIALA